MKGHFASSRGVSPSNIIHATVMPWSVRSSSLFFPLHLSLDRRAESEREENLGSVDLVITSQEVDPYFVSFP